MLVLVTNNSQVPVYVDVIGKGLPEHKHILGPKMKDTLNIEEAQLNKLKTTYGNQVLFKSVGGK